MEMNTVYEGMTPKEKEAFIAAYPIFSKEMLPIIKQRLESKGFDPKNPPTQEQQNEMMAELMPTLLTSINKMISTVEGVDIMTLMSAISKGLSNMQLSKGPSKDELDKILDN
jgi:hypothetical protein